MNAFFLFLSLLLAQSDDKVYREYYKNGKVKSVTRQGIFQGCGVPVGTDSLFNANGILSKTISYTHIKDAKLNGCHAIQTYEKQVQMKPDGKALSIKYFTYGYESTPVAISASKYNAMVKQGHKSN